MSDPASPMDDLIAAHLHGELSEAQRQQLNQALRADGTAREQFLAALRQDILLGEVLREKIERQDIRKAASAEIAKPAVASAPKVRVQWRVWPIAAALAAFVAIAATLFFSLKRAEPPQAVALVVSASPGAMIQQGEKFAHAVAGSGLFSRDRLTTAVNGTVSLRYADGTALIVKENSAAVFDLPKHGGKTIALEKGALSADVVKQPTNQPMILSTSDAVATVLGTRFTLAAELGQSTLAVDEGRVKLQRKSDETTLEVSTGNIAVVAANVAGIEMRSLTQKPAPIPARQPPAADNRPKALLVTAERIPYFAHDAAIKAILEEMGYNVIEKLFNDVAAADAKDKALILVPSHRCRNTRVFAEVNVPVICWHAVWYEDLGMADPATAKSDGPKPTRVKFNAHPLLASVTVPPDAPKMMVYASGQPAPRAEIMAVLADTPQKAAIFGYEKDAPMYGFTARARRLAFSLDIRNSPDAPVDLSKHLLMAAITWATAKAGE
jgi:hypothetical protein